MDDEPVRQRERLGRPIRFAAAAAATTRPRGISAPARPCCDSDVPHDPSPGTSQLSEASKTPDPTLEEQSSKLVAAEKRRATTCCREIMQGTDARVGPYEIQRIGRD